MLTEKDKSIIEQFVDERFYNRDKLVKYLSIHEIVGNEVFEYCLKKEYASEHWNVRNSRWLEDEHGYQPLSVPRFLKRVPFYFFVADYDNNKVGDLGCILSGALHDIRRKQNLEEYYLILEYMFYERKLTLEDIFQYTIDQTHLVSQNEIFLQWNHYLHLCDSLGIDDPKPERFITRYNEVLEKCALKPVIYEIRDMCMGDVFWRNGSQIEFEGVFPCDENGNPIMKWIGLQVKNGGEIYCSCTKSEPGTLVVNLKPDTMIYALNVYNKKSEAGDYWYQIYAGPLKMEFDYEAIRDARIRLKYTQKQVAEAIGASVRTYQKWECGETTPDGHYLMRILNWLDLPSVQYVTHYTE